MSTVKIIPTINLAQATTKPSGLSQKLPDEIRVNSSLNGGESSTVRDG